jgi:hypothetical protein
MSIDTKLNIHSNNDKQNKYKIVILGLDPGIQGFFNINMKDFKFLNNNE